MSEIIKIQNEVDVELSNPEAMKMLVLTTFKGLSATNVKQAMVEGYMRGFTFKDFLEKNIYAISYGNTYNLVTSIDYARKIGMKSGIVGKDEPKYETDENGSVTACSVSVKRKFPNDDYVGDFTAKVYFAEYSTGKNLWLSKPRTMLAKVAEMHALRMACPEELSQSYVEEEMERKDVASEPHFDVTEFQIKLESTGSTEELQRVWVSLPGSVKVALEKFKNELKEKYAQGGI